MATTTRCRSWSRCDLPGSPYPGSRLYTYLRDELGTVIGLIAEDEGSDPQHPSLPVRYRYSPYGEVHAETAPELRRVRFDNEVTEVDSVVQSIADPALAAAGVLRASLSVRVVPESLSAGMVVERLQPGGGWMAVDSSEVVVKSDGAEPADLLGLAAQRLAARGFVSGRSDRGAGGSRGSQLRGLGEPGMERSAVECRAAGTAGDL